MLNTTTNELSTAVDSSPEESDIEYLNGESPSEDELPEPLKTAADNGTLAEFLDSRNQSLLSHVAWNKVLCYRLYNLGAPGTRSELLSEVQWNLVKQYLNLWFTKREGARPKKKGQPTLVHIYACHGHRRKTREPKGKELRDRVSLFFLLLVNDH